MITQSQNIPCPVCNTGIPFDIKQLMMGVHFACPNCAASVGLAPESKELVEETIEKLEAVKGRISA
ncbi:hypothetical protein EZ428_12275 [Pedobacter frigiditerrae]|uniref:Uncharacterized protein n=1 Tax=Pedobacter frigiditerrae TaxID=2530452 RepID=A0A4R0MSR5_9SPHI|nr:hypothetical protein [Pedobacter frigiditerrae]TCC90059.1 hypothetical protein EZ428_12275 [Pedobacter frigiditerrae]